jgi:hypothetical protein
VRADDALLVEQSQLAGLLEHALDHKHHVGAAGVVLVEDQRDVVLQRPGQDAVLELGDLLAVLQHDRVLADEIETRDVAVEVDADAGPVEARRDLLDMGRLAGAVIAGDHDAAVMREARQDRDGGVAVEAVIRIEIGDMGLGFGIGRHFEIGIDAEGLAHRQLHVGQGRGGRRCHRLVSGRGTLPGA